MSTPEFVKGASGRDPWLPGGGQTIVPTYLGGSSSSATAMTTVTPTASVTRKSTAKVVNTTTSATDLLNGELSLAANALGSTGVARLTCHGDWKQNSGGDTDLPRFQFVLGGTTILDTNVTGVATIAVNSATRFPWRIEITVAETNATNTQSVSMKGEILFNQAGSAPQTAFTTGEGLYSVPSTASKIASFGGWNSGAKDGTAILTVVLNVINASANANYETVLKDAIMEIL